MLIRIKPFASLRELIPAARDTGEALLEFPEGTSLEQVIASLKLPIDMPLVTVVNGNRPVPGQDLNEGDEVMIITPVFGG